MATITKSALTKTTKHSILYERCNMQLYNMEFLLFSFQLDKYHAANLCIFYYYIVICRSFCVENKWLLAFRCWLSAVFFYTLMPIILSRISLILPSWQFDIWIECQIESVIKCCIFFNFIFMLQLLASLIEWNTVNYNREKLQISCRSFNNFFLARLYF